MKYFVKFHSKEKLLKLLYTYEDYSGDINHKNKFAYIKKIHLGQIVNITEYNFYYKDGKFRNLDWAIKEKLTKNKYPEYYL